MCYDDHLYVDELVLGVLYALISSYYSLLIKFQFVELMALSTHNNYVVFTSLHHKEKAF